MPARIYKQAKPAGQSGVAGTKEWILEYGQSAPRLRSRLMGWNGSTDDTISQIRLYFVSCEEAVAYAERHGIHAEIEKTAQRIRSPKIYADNFAYNRLENWTH
ncbi:oxidoreductase [Acetobacter sp. DmW_043]|uniref:ETC complex I subunit n=1 Tax=Acetobacter sp. DmW_043 TaxID=1670658 RepID=UPI000A3A4BEB|nr:ETC complex I subunit [Acetobacter sp. DmW_043]OUI87935.1 oxidoreductase [Acetobacter sp. DmW_043]